MNIAFSSFLPYDLSLLTFSEQCQQVAAVIRNKTLLEVIFIADQVIGVDGPSSLYVQYTPTILTQALALYNNNFVNCNNKNPSCFTCTANTNDAVIIPVSTSDPELIELSQRLPKSGKTQPISSDEGEVDVPILMAIFVFVTVIIALYCLAGWLGKRANRQYRRL
jgi:hypothetical protein